MENVGVGETDAPFAVLLKRTLVLVLLAAGGVTTCYFFVDRPVAWFVHDHLIPQNDHFLKYVQEPPGWFDWLAPLVIVGLMIRRAGGPFTHLEWALLAAALNLIVTLNFKDNLKFVFGRYWPDTWINHNPSFIDTGAYGFNPFHDGVNYASFPSGHTARIVSVMAVFWFAFPKGRWLWITLAMAVMIALVGMNYHFVGDCLAGAVLGTITAMYTAHFFELDRVATEKIAHLPPS